MTFTFLLRFAVAAVLAMVIASLIASRPAASATLRPAITVDGDLVTLGDLFDEAGDLAARPVFRSPDPGVKGALPAAEAIAAARTAGLVVDTTPVAVVEVVRRSVSISPTSLAGMLATIAGERLGENADDVAIGFDVEPEPIEADASASEPVAVASFAFQTLTGRFRAVITVDAGAAAREIAVSGTATITREVPVLAVDISRGAVIGEKDVAIERRDLRSIPKAAVTDPANLVGMATRRSLRSGAMVAVDAVEPPKVVHRGQLVTMVYASKGIALTARGRALADAAVGEPVAVLNERSKRTVEGVAVGPDKVEITAPSLRTAAAVASRTVE